MVMMVFGAADMGAVVPFAPRFNTAAGFFCAAFETRTVLTMALRLPS
ncbi:hypothetical protein QO034_10935 [Sedimentitalea sp. JM2-8]|uniref:Uncharacterized protein n=1 Tax=Sedimentitalea xiamensis TaxID=3050037 RepID=A0ABT7FES5_9RHOB|nr:hypothetical protein [Sedimentitalea xiamensis]MDK3073627.1 hypothetical protein [Sedimentitalea xiamensis]